MSTGDGLAERVEALEGFEAARGLLARYAAAMDAKSVSGLDELLADDVVVEAASPIEGRAAVLDFFRGAFARDSAEKSHFVTNVQVRSAGPGRVAVDAGFLFTAAGDDTSVLGWGTYADEVVILDGVARFSRLRIAVRRSGDVRAGWATASAAG